MGKLNQGRISGQKCISYPVQLHLRDLQEARVNHKLYYVIFCCYYDVVFELLEKKIDFFFNVRIELDLDGI